MPFDSSVLVETDFGPLVVDLRFNAEPSGVENFIRLCEIGYYRNTLIFNVENDFLAFGGDPTGTGNGGSTFGELAASVGFSFEATARLPPSSHEVEDWEGNVVCALGSTSQFVITLADAKSNRFDQLRSKQVYIGKIVEDPSNAIASLSKSYVDEKGRPLRDIRIRRTIMLVYPPGMIPLASDQIKAFLPVVPQPDIDVPQQEWGQIEERSSVLSQEIMQDLNEDEARARKEKLLADSRAVELEILGDLTSAEAKPKENILFVCKLNPVTKSKDLELIFSRFGSVVDCEVKRDAVTKESLGYAFIAFETKQQCEEAYRKMQDVVIDGRRIKVDFSQSEGKKVFGSTRPDDAAKTKGVRHQAPRPRSHDRSKPKRDRSVSSSSSSLSYEREKRKKKSKKHKSRKRSEDRSRRHRKEEVSRSGRSRSRSRERR